MPRELKNANISHVSYVDKAANQKQFFLMKSKSQPTFSKNVQILTKAEDEQQLVYGVVYEPNVEDVHGDFMTASEIEKAAHKFMKEYQNIDTQHNFVEGAGELVESYVTPAEFEVGGQTIAKGSWVIVTKATNEVWESIKKGDITGYSMAGTAEVIEDQEIETAKSFFDHVKKFFAGKTENVAKGEVQDKFYGDKKYREFFDALYIFEDVFYSEVWSGAPDTQRIKDAANDFANLLSAIADQPDTFLKSFEGVKKEDVQKAKIEKAGKKISAKRMADIQAAFDTLGKVISEASDAETESVEKSEEVNEVKLEDVQNIVKEALAPLAAKLESLEKSGEETTEKVEETVEAVEATVTKEELADIMKQALAPFAERLETVEKARGIQKAAKVDEEATEEVQKSGGELWGSLFGMSR